MTLKSSALPSLLTVALLAIATAGFAADRAPNQPALAKGPPANWAFETAALKSLKPSAAQVLTRPAAATGDYDVAKAPPSVRFGVLPGQWTGASLWSAWGDAIFASDTNFYCSIGDHAAPHGWAYVYQVNPRSGAIQMIVDVNQILKIPAADYAPGKIHAPLMEHDGALLFAGYRGGKGVDDEHHYKGDALIRWSLADGATTSFDPPATFCSFAASVIHAPSKSIYGVGPGGARLNGEARFFVYDIEARKTRFCGTPQPDVTRAIVVAPDGRAWYSSGGGKDATSRFARYDPKTKKATLMDLAVPGNMLRAASRCNDDGIAYCISNDGVLFTFDTRTEKVRVVGKSFDAGPAYTAVCKLSPDGRYLYYAPGAHGGADGVGCPVVQLDTRTNRRKVVAFLFDYLKGNANYHTGGSFGLDVSADGATLGICFNGWKMDETRSAQGLKSFDQVSVVLLDIPASERP